MEAVWVPFLVLPALDQFGVIIGVGGEKKEIPKKGRPALVQFDVIGLGVGDMGRGKERKRFLKRYLKKNLIGKKWMLAERNSNSIC